MSRYLEYLESSRFFLEELPDSNVELFNQVPTITHFPQFFSLPPNARYEIWHLMRARRIRATIDGNGILHTRTPDPVTFKICRESRFATIKFYQEPYQLASHPGNGTIAALHGHYFDPKVDKIVLHKRNPGDATLFMQYSTSDKREELGVVQSLEVPRYDWSILMFAGWKVWSEGFSSHLSYFRCFRGLEELVLIGGGHGLRTEQEQEECKDAFKRVFETFNTFYSDYSIPNIIIKMP